MCKTVKDDSEFNCGASLRQTVVCLECTTKAKESFYKRVKSGDTTKGKAKVKKRPRRNLLKPEGSVLKRCPFCNANLWVVQTDPKMPCWKCGCDLKISLAIRDSTYHRHGVILSVIQ